MIVYLKDVTPNVLIGGPVRIRLDSAEACGNDKREIRAAACADLPLSNGC